MCNQIANYAPCPPREMPAEAASLRCTYCRHPSFDPIAQATRIPALDPNDRDWLMGGYMQALAHLLGYHRHRLGLTIEEGCARGSQQGPPSVRRDSAW